MSFHTKVHPEPPMDGNDSPKPFLAERAQASDDNEFDTFVLSPPERRVSSCSLFDHRAASVKLSQSAWNKSACHRHHSV